MYKEVAVDLVQEGERCCERRNASCGQCLRERARKPDFEIAFGDKFLFLHFLHFLHGPFIKRSISVLLLVSQNVKYRKNTTLIVFPYQNGFYIYAVSQIGHLVTSACMLGNPVFIQQSENQSTIGQSVLITTIKKKHALSNFKLLLSRETQTKLV